MNDLITVILPIVAIVVMTVVYVSITQLVRADLGFGRNPNFAHPYEYVEV